MDNGITAIEMLADIRRRTLGIVTLQCDSDGWTATAERGNETLEFTGRTPVAAIKQLYVELMS